MRIAVIPARGGSKRIPRKNIKQFCGKPMIAWSIETALRSDCFDEVLVSTDDAEIAEVARNWGATTPFLRPAELSGDHTGTVPVIQHAIKSYETKGKSITETCCLYATAPFVQASDIREGLKRLEESSLSFVMSVTTFPFPIQRALRSTPDGRISMFHPEHLNTRSQDLEEAFHDAGQFYWGTSSAWISDTPVFGPETGPLFLPRHRVQDIDTPEDWIRAEWLFKAMQAEA